MIGLSYQIKREMASAYTFKVEIKKIVPYQNIRKGEYYIKEYASDELAALQDEGYALTM